MKKIQETEGVQTGSSLPAVVTLDVDNCLNGENLWRDWHEETIQLGDKEKLEVHFSLAREIPPQDLAVPDKPRTITLTSNQVSLKGLNVIEVMSLIRYLLRQRRLELPPPGGEALEYAVPLSSEVSLPRNYRYERLAKTTLARVMVWLEDVERENDGTSTAILYVRVGVARNGGQRLLSALNLGKTELPLPSRAVA